MEHEFRDRAKALDEGRTCDQRDGEPQVVTLVEGNVPKRYLSVLGLSCGPL